MLSRFHQSRAGCRAAGGGGGNGGFGGGGGGAGLQAICGSDGWAARVAWWSLPSTLQKIVEA
jgi:hypothetical protein